MTKEQAIAAIFQKIQLLKPIQTLKPEELEFWIEKLVLDVLDYCHRKDFPEALIYACVDLILKRLSDTEMAADYEGSPLSEIKEDDTTYKFDNIKTTAADNVGLLSDADFYSIKPKLNLYRKVVSR